MEQKTITVIVPVYNTEKYLRRCIDSIRCQTYRALDIILVDDGSTDSCRSICEEYALADPRITALFQENGGSSSARNQGLRHANGDYIGFVDSDDYLEPFFYEVLMNAIERFQVRIAQIGRREIAEDGTELPPVCLPPGGDICCPSSDFLKELLLHRGDCSFCTKLIDRALFQGTENRFPTGVLNEDFYLLVRLLSQGNDVAMVKERGYFVYYRSGSNTRKESSEAFSRVYGDCVDNADMVEKLVGSRYPQLREIAFRFAMFQRSEYLLHIPISKMTADNRQYRDIVAYVRRHIAVMVPNRYLTVKNKIYLLLFALCPRTVRKLHRTIRRGR